MTIVLVVPAAAAVLAVAVVLARRSSGVVTVDPGAARPPSRDLDGVRSLAAAGRTLDAIKLFRELTGADLKAAKDAVDLIARGGSVAPSAVRPAPAPLAEADARILSLLREKKPIEAIKAYRAAYGTDLKGAKDAIDRIVSRLEREVS